MASVIAAWHVIALHSVFLDLATAAPRSQEQGPGQLAAAVAQWALDTVEGTSSPPAEFPSSTGVFNSTSASAPVDASRMNVEAPFFHNSDIATMGLMPPASLEVTAEAAAAAGVESEKDLQRSSRDVQKAREQVKEAVIFQEKLRQQKRATAEAITRAELQRDRAATQVEKDTGVVLRDVHEAEQELVEGHRRLQQINDKLKSAVSAEEGARARLQGLLNSVISLKKDKLEVFAPTSEGEAGQQDDKHREELNTTLMDEKDRLEQARAAADRELHGVRKVREQVEHMVAQSAAVVKRLAEQEAAIQVTKRAAVKELQTARRAWRGIATASTDFHPSTVATVASSMGSSAGVSAAVSAKSNSQSTVVSPGNSSQLAIAAGGSSKLRGASNITMADATKVFTMGICTPTGVYKRSACCPLGYKQISDAITCRAAFRALQLDGVSWGGLVDRKRRPSGCFRNPEVQKVRFNRVGVANLGLELYGNDEVICQKAIAAHAKASPPHRKAATISASTAKHEVWATAAVGATEPASHKANSASPKASPATAPAGASKKPAVEEPLTLQKMAGIAAVASKPTPCATSSSSPLATQSPGAAFAVPAEVIRAQEQSLDVTQGSKKSKAVEDVIGAMERQLNWS